MKRLSALVFIFIFSFCYSQVSEFQKADERYNRKIKALMKKYPKVNNQRTKQEWLFTEEKLTSYKNALDKIQKEEIREKNIVPSTMPKITKESEYETGTASFKKLFKETLDHSLLTFSSYPYEATLTFVVDAKGEVYRAQISNGKNPDINAFILAAFYRIRDKGKWKPAESNGKPVPSVVTFPVNINTDK